MDNTRKQESEVKHANTGSTDALVNRMQRRALVRSDGRYLIYYSFGDKRENQKDTNMKEGE